MKNLREIAEEKGLKVIETTPQRNGYPANLKDAIIGFDTFEEAKELADEHGLSIEVFEKKDGWALWYRTGGTKYEAFEIDADYYGDNYQSFSNDVDEADFIEEQVMPLMHDIADFHDLQRIINSKKEIFDEIEHAENDELVITREGYFYDVVKQTTMYFHYDTKHEVIGLIRRD